MKPDGSFPFCARRKHAAISVLRKAASVSWASGKKGERPAKFDYQQHIIYEWIENHFAAVLCPGRSPLYWSWWRRNARRSAQTTWACRCSCRPILNLGWFFLSIVIFIFHSPSCHQIPVCCLTFRLLFICLQIHRLQYHCRQTNHCSQCGFILLCFMIHDIHDFCRALQRQHGRRKRRCLVQKYLQGNMK